MALARLTAAAVGVAACRPAGSLPAADRVAAVPIAAAVAAAPLAGDRLGHAIVADGGGVWVSAPGAAGGAGAIERRGNTGGSAEVRTAIIVGDHPQSRLGQALTLDPEGGLWATAIDPTGGASVRGPSGGLPVALPGPGQGAALLLRGEELLVGIPLHADRAGLVVSVSLRTGETRSSTGESPGSLSGATLTDAGDLDGDGIAEVAAGAWGAAGLRGAVAIWSGAAPAALADADAVVWGERPWDLVGTGIAGGGDLDGDGLAELWIGAPGDDRAGWSAGAAWWLSRPRTGPVHQGRGAVLGGEPGARVGQALAVDRASGRVAAGAPGARGSRGGAGLWARAPRGLHTWAWAQEIGAPEGVGGAGGALAWGHDASGPRLWLGAEDSGGEAGALLRWPAP